MTAAEQAARLEGLARELKLTEKQRVLAEGIADGLRAVDAARKAGYSGDNRSAALNVIAHRTLKLSKVQRYMDEYARVAASSARHRIRQAVLGRRAVLRLLSAQADADIGRYLRLNDDGEVEGFRIPKDTTRAIRALKLTERTIQQDDGPPVVERQVELRVADPVPALSLLAKHHRLVDGDQGEGKALAVQVNLLVQQAPPGELGRAVVDVLRRRA